MIILCECLWTQYGCREQEELSSDRNGADNAVCPKTDGFEMSSNFNSRLKPAEVLVRDGNASLIRRRDEFEDLLRNQVL